MSLEQMMILFGLSGHGHFDLAAYGSYLSGMLEEGACDEGQLARSFARLLALAGAALRGGQAQ